MLSKTEKSQKEYLMDFVSRAALPSFLEGDLSYAAVLHRVFALDDAKRYHIEIANAYTKRLNESGAKRILYLDERCRQYPAYYDWVPSRLWKPCWEEVSLSRDCFPHLSDVQYLSVLKFGAFHADGYCRQKSLAELSAYADTLLYFVLRMNDWVSSVRKTAYKFAQKRLEACDMHELLSAMPVFDKLTISRRRNADHLNHLKQLIAESMTSKAQSIELDQVHTYDVAVKNAIYRFVNENPALSPDAMKTLLHYTKDGYGKRLIIRGILYHYDNDPKQIQEFLESRSGIVRYETLVYWYDLKLKRPWAGLESFLMDKAKKIRLEAAYILEKHQVLNVLDYYKERLTNNNKCSSTLNAMALCGIGEHGCAADASLVEPFLTSEDERLVKAALTAYMSLAAEQGEDICWKYLFDSRPGLSKRAFTAIVKHQIHYGPKQLYSAYQQQSSEQIKKYLLQLLCAEPSTWGRLPYLLVLWSKSAEKAQEIRELLDWLSHTKPLPDMEKLMKTIEFELKLVTR